MITVDWITSPYPYLPRSPERTEGWKDINLISEHGNYPTSATRSPCRTRTLCFVARQFSLCDISASAHRSSAWFCSNCGCFSCSQVTNHSSRDKMLVFNQTVLLCSNFVCSCRLICWMMLRLFSSCRAEVWFVARISKNESRFVLILYSRKVSCRKVSLSRTRCAGRGLGLVPLRFPLVPLNWISDDIRKNHLVH